METTPTPVNVEEVGTLVIYVMWTLMSVRSVVPVLDQESVKTSSHFIGVTVRRDSAEMTAGKVCRFRTIRSCFAGWECNELLVLCINKYKT